MKFILAGNNPGKLREMNEILTEIGIEVIRQSELGFDIHTEETGNTFEENAFLKANELMLASGMPAIADDSGLEVDALGGQPGVYSARYGGESCKTDADRTALLLKNMENRELRTARFVSSIACVFPDGRRIAVRGEVEGEITLEPRGEGGFGYDPVFYLKEFAATMAEISQEEKNAVSHRGRALQKLKTELERMRYVDNKTESAAQSAGQ